MLSSIKKYTSIPKRYKEKYLFLKLSLLNSALDSRNIDNPYIGIRAYFSIISLLATMNSEAAMDAAQNQSTVPSPNLATIMEQLRAEILQSLAPAITELRDNQNLLQAAVQQQDQAPRRPSIKPTKPDTFKPNNMDLNLWLFELETYMTFVGLCEEDKVPFAVTLLRGAATSWWRNHLADSKQVSWNQWNIFKEELRKQFQPINPVKVARDKLAFLRQINSVQDYTQRFYALTLEIPSMSEDEAMDRYVRGLKPRVAKEIELRGLTNLNDTIQAAQRFDVIDFRHGIRNLPLGGSSFTSVPMGPAQMELGALSTTNEHEELNMTQARNHRGKLTTEQKEELRKEGKCFYCKQTGHIALQCPNKARSGNGMWR